VFHRDRTAKGVSVVGEDRPVSPDLLVAGGRSLAARDEHCLRSQFRGRGVRRGGLELAVDRDLPGGDPEPRELSNRVGQARALAWSADLVRGRQDQPARRGLSPEDSLALLAARI
jgi:hypothetical protein